MPLASYLEQVGIDKGERRGLVKAITLGLRLKYGAEGNALTSQVEKIQELVTLQAIYDAIEPATSLDDIRKLMLNGASPTS